MGADQHKIYYVIIFGNQVDDHLNLRRVINKMFPQAIVESLYLNPESLSFLAQHSAAPDLIFVQNNARCNDGSLLLTHIKTVADLHQVPIIIFGDEAEEKFELPASRVLPTAYFKRSFGTNTVAWLARNLMGKFDQLVSLNK